MADNFFNTVFCPILKDTMFSDHINPLELPLSCLPGAGIRLFGCETVIGESSRHPDAAICFTEESFGSLVTWCSSMTRTQTGDSYWECLSDAIEAENISIDSNIDQIWIELDSAAFNNNNGGREPAIFMRFAENHNLSNYFEETTLSRFTGGRLSPLIHQHLVRCMQTLPASSELVYTGYFPGRSKSTLRATFALPAGFDLSLNSNKLFNKRTPDNIRRILDDLSEFYDFAVLHLDIGDDIKEKIGLEFRYNNEENYVGNRERLKKILILLAEQGFCNERIIEDLLQFHGEIRSLDSKTFLPTWYKRFIYYIKGVFTLSGDIHFKAYCACKKIERG